MKSLLTALLTVSLVTTPLLAFAQAEQALETSSAEAAPAELTQAGEPVVNRMYPYVEPDQIPVVVTAVQAERAEVLDEIKRKILREFTPIRLTIHNKSGKMLNIPPHSVFFVDQQGNQMSVPTAQDIFQEVKRNGVGRSLLWSVPLGVVSFGLLLIPAAALSGVHTKVLNTGVKDNLAANAFEGSHISPDGSLTTYVFAPKHQMRGIQAILLTRVINTEDQLETQYVTNVQKLETVHETQK